MSDGGNNIRHYLVEYKGSDGFRWTKANDGERTPETYYRVSGLHADTDYEFRVSAENKAGYGPYSDTTTPIRAKDPIGELLYWDI